MRIILIVSLSILLTLRGVAQGGATERMLSDTTMKYSTVSFCLLNGSTGEIIYSHNESKSLSQASVMKLVTTAAALEILGPDYTFKTIIGYSGSIKSGVLHGDIIVKGGGDPTLGSPKFNEHYGRFIEAWTALLKTIGIKKINGNIIVDDSYYDYNPVPPNWNWEDLGNYYGAGPYGLSVFDNTIFLHFKTGDQGTKPVLTSSWPSNAGIIYDNRLISAGTTDQGYVYAAPFATTGWIEGEIPVNREDFQLKASIPDPPLTLARILKDSLQFTGIRVSGNPLTTRIMAKSANFNFLPLDTVFSPKLAEIINVLNHESVNLYAEHLVKELGKVKKNEGSTAAGVEIIKSFLDSIGVDAKGMFIEDGSGLSPQDALNSKGLATLLFMMKTKGRYFNEYLSSLPEAGKNGTLKNVFRDPVFENNLRAKSGTILRVRSYAGYMKAKSGNDLIFSIIVNNYTGPGARLVAHFSEILKESILNN